MIEIIFLLIVLYCLYRIWNDGYYAADDIGFCLFLSIAMIFLTSMVGFLVCLMLNNTIIPPIVTKIENCERKIYSLGNQQEINGAFYLGGGIINSVDSYYTYVKNSDNGFERWSLPTNNSILYQDANENQRIVWKKYHYTTSKWIAIYPKIEQMVDGTYNFHVPSTTIIQTFKAN